MASITPLLKKKELDTDVTSNYRPISNLHTISKMLERLFMARIRPHVKARPLAYAVHHSCGSTPTSTDAVSMLEWEIASCLPSDVTTESRKVVCSGLCCSLHLADRQCYRPVQRRTPRPICRRHSTQHRTQHRQCFQRYQRLFFVSKSLVRRQRALPESGQI